MKVTLSDGMILDGSVDQIRKTLEKLGLSGDGLFYNSGTRGLVLITEMQSLHLRNAILKMYIQWVDSLHKISEPKGVAEEILGGNTDPTFVAMLRELYSRDE